MDEAFDCRGVVAPTGSSPSFVREMEAALLNLAEMLRLHGLMDLEVIQTPEGMRVLEMPVSRARRPRLYGCPRASTSRNIWRPAFFPMLRGPALAHHASPGMNMSFVKTAGCIFSVSTSWGSSALWSR